MESPPKEQIVPQLVSGIYAIRNAINGKIYIGSTLSFHKRRCVHRSQLRQNTHKNAHLRQAWKRYGENSFEFFILEECAPTMLIARETAWVTHYNAMDAAYGYNLAFPDRHTITDATRKKLSEASKRSVGRPCTEATKEKLRSSMLGRKATMETRKKISNAGRSRVATAETRKKLSDASKKRKMTIAGWNKGMAMPETTRKKLAAAMTGRTSWNKGIPRSATTRKKISETQKGRPGWWQGKTLSEEHKRHLSEVRKGRVPWNKGIKGIPLSTEHRKKLSQAHQTRLAKQRLTPQASVPAAITIHGDAA